MLSLTNLLVSSKKVLIPVVVAFTDTCNGSNDDTLLSMASGWPYRMVSLIKDGVEEEVSESTCLLMREIASWICGSGTREVRALLRIVQ